MITVNDSGFRNLKDALGNLEGAQEDIALTKGGEYVFPAGGGLAELQDIILYARQRGDEKVIDLVRPLIGEFYGDSYESLDENYAIPVLAINPVGKEQLATQWIQILPLGEVHTVDGRFLRVTETGLKKMLATWETHKTELVVDYEHNSLNPFAAENPAAGWVESLEIREDGVYAQVRWTARAKGMIEAREYRYISPVVGLDADTDEAVALYSVAITNTPAIDGMQPLAASKTVVVTGAAPAPTSDSSDIVNPNSGDTQMIEALASELGVEATTEAIKEHFVSLKSKVEEQEQELVTATTKLLELASEKAEMEAKAKIDAAIDEGRISESQREFALSLSRESDDLFNQFLSASPEGVHRPPQDVVVTPEALSAAAEAKILDTSNRTELHQHALQLSKKTGIGYAEAVNQILEEARNE